MIKLATAVLACCVLGSGLAGAATIVGGTYDVTTSGTATASVTDILASPFSMPMTVGTPVTVDFITLHTLEPIGLQNYTLGLDANFAFTQPGSQGLSDPGSGNVGIFGIFTVGGLSWSDGASGTNVAFGNGAVLNVNLQNVSFAGFLQTDTEIDATFTLTHAPNPVPEPASLAVLGVGLVGWAAARRRRQN